MKKRIKKGEQDYIDGMTWVRHENYSEAFKSFEKALNNGYIEAANNLGIMYLSGQFVDQDYKKALSYFLDVADIPETNAAYNAARILASGDAGYTDSKRAISLYEIAIRKRDKEAANNVGIMYLEDKLIPRNVSKAIKYLQIASDLGHERAPYTLANLYLEQGGDIVKSRKFFELSLERGFVESALSLVQLYGDKYLIDANSEELEIKYTKLILEGSNDETKLELALYILKRPQIESFYKAKEIIQSLVENQYPAAVNMFSYRNPIKHSEGYVDVEINSILADLYMVVSLIKESHAFYKGEVSHFTSWLAMESILSLNQPGNCLRYYHVDYMNDPSEGKTLLTHQTHEGSEEKTSKLVIDSFVSKVFDLKPLVKDTLPSVYSLSFTSESDRLDLWRAYGADGYGYSITTEINEERSYERVSFAQGAFSEYIGINSSNNTLLKKPKEEAENEPTKIPKLYHVKYDNDSIEKTLKLINEPLSKLKNKIESRSEPVIDSESIKLIVSSILLDIMYLYKDEQYATEKEVRAIRVEPLSNVLLDERQPARLFCQTENFLFKKSKTRITIGPKVEEKSVSLWNLRYRINQLKFSNTTSVDISKVQYR